MVECLNVWKCDVWKHLKGMFGLLNIWMFEIRVNDWMFECMNVWNVWKVCLIVECLKVWMFDFLNKTHLIDLLLKKFKHFFEKFIIQDKNYESFFKAMITFSED